ncbi:hypothetical protein [Paracoccus sp. SSK6]|uniref:hypothetical protein n=1 Tax=Paracoccus sp. SSK6 TaxID=3143131 RepID=UPI00321B64B4
MTSWPLPVASFWAGEDLSFVEQMVIRSYLDQGADFTLYLGHPVGGIPEGVRIEDAATILPTPGFASDGPGRKQLAVWSDLFRVALLRQRRMIWVDMDAYCVAPFALRDGYALGLNNEGTVLSGVMAMPSESPALSFMANVLSRDRIEPPWADEAWLARKRKQDRLGPQDLPWGDTGPRLLGHALRESGEIAHAAPPQVFYPLFRASLPLLWRPGVPDAMIQHPDTRSVHIFGYTKRYLWTHHRGLPPAGTWLARAAARHGIDPAQAPAKGEPLA